MRFHHGFDSPGAPWIRVAPSAALVYVLRPLLSFPVALAPRHTERIIEPSDARLRRMVSSSPRVWRRTPCSTPPPSGTLFTDRLRLRQT